MRSIIQRRTSLLGLMLASLGLTLIGGALAPAQEGPAAQFTPQQIEFFESKVRPILVNRCYECHGDVGDKLKGGLRVDSRTALLRGGDTGPSIDEKEPEKSLLLDAIRYGDTYQMPPKNKLPDDELAILEKWILEKAPWPAESAEGDGAPKQFDLEGRIKEHWAWKPVEAPPVPQVKDASWPASDVDRFILARLEEKQLTPSPPADKRVLIRRLYFDLLGLPPPPERVAEFLADDRPDAYARLVDSLLQSPQFGERWGRHWLDVVAYAETRGHEFDYDIPGAPVYRDYVIRAFNEDLPFNQFALEHIAGDLIDRRDEKNRHVSALGTGFWFLGEWLHSPVDIRKDEADRFDRMIDVYSKAFLGLTVACARCHDHKFDAISQKDYYALSGFLQSMEYRQYRFETVAKEQEAAKTLLSAEASLQSQWKPRIAEQLRAAIVEAGPYLEAALAGEEAVAESSLNAERLAAWKKELQGVRFVSSENAPARPETAISGRVIDDFSGPLMQDGFAFGDVARPIGELLFSGDAGRPVAGVRRIAAASFLPEFASLTVEKTPREMGSLGATVRSGRTLRSKTFVLEGPVLHYLVRGAGRAFAAVDSHRAIAGPLHGHLITAFNDKTGAWRWVRHDLRDYVGHNLHVEFSPDGEGPFEVALIVESEQPPFSLDEPLPPWKRLAPAQCKSDLEGLIEAWKAGEPLTAEQAADLDAMLRRADLFPLPPADDGQKSQWAAYEKQRQEWKAQLAQPTRTSLAAWEGNPFDDELLIRGNVRVRGDRVPRAFLTALQAPTRSAPEGASRLDLAQSTISPDNPFFARVAVNRVWKFLFGRGIVPTVDNFGVLGLPPSHPELLDHLAVDFMRDGYSIKRLIKRLVLTRTYQQQAAHRPEADAIDPDNLLLHRMNLRRRDAEAIRDGFLALSGRLDLSPPMGESIPVHLTPYMEGRGRPGASGPLDGAGKRSVYLAVRRNFLNPFLMVFDFPSPAAPFGQRNQSNVPAQALALLNDPFVHEQAKTWAGALLAQPGDFGQRLAAAHQTAFSRGVTEAEIAFWRDFAQEQGAALGLSPADAEANPQVWADICHLLMNSKEFLFVE